MRGVRQCRARCSTPFGSTSSPARDSQVPYAAPAPLRRVRRVQLIYYAHSYRPADNPINEFFQELMVDEALTPSLDPQSDRLNAAKPERHLQCTDAMVVVLPQRDPAPSEYIRWEIALGLRARMPQLVFVEDTLPDDLVPQGILQRRFSRRRLLREARDHRNAVRILKTYIGSDPPPTYEPTSLRRRCAVIGSQRMGRDSVDALVKTIERCRYSAVVVAAGRRLPDEMAAEESVRRAAVCLAVVEGLTPSEIYLFGAARASLTPTIAITLDPAYRYNESTPREYQPRFAPPGDTTNLVRVVEQEIEIFEEDYLELKEESQVHRYRGYRDAVMRTQRPEGQYSPEERQQAFIFLGNTEVDMSANKVAVSNVVGPVNIQSRLDRVTQTVQQAPGWPDARKEELTLLMSELKAALDAAAKSRPDDAERVAKTAELVVAEATKAKPDKGFMSITAEGLKKAAEAVADIAPAALVVAGKVAAFVAGLA